MTTHAVDAHMHFWKVTENDWYPQLRPFAEQVGSTTLYSDFMPADYTAAATGLDVQGFVHVSATTEPRAYLEETRWVDQLADEYELDLVIIGSIDPELPTGEMVADLEAQAASPRFRGVRVFPGIDPNLPAATVLLKWLEDNDHVFDLVTQPESMPSWTQRLARHPNLRVVMEHTGWPSAVDAAGLQQWRTAITDLARTTDVVCKVAGLGMATMDLSENTLRPWIEGAVEAFGWDRLVFGSNMPIETMAGTYAQWIATLDAVIGTASPDEQNRFYTDNARRCYQL